MAAAKASCASEAPFCKACRTERRIYECHRVPGEEGALARKMRALETPAAAASGTTGDVAESEAEPAPAVTCSSASVLWD